MSNVNLSPIQPPRKWLEDPEVRRNVEDLYFTVYQLFERTGGGSDNFEELQLQININKADIAALDIRVTNNEGDIVALTIRVGDNEINIALLDIRVTQNESDIQDNADAIAALQQTFSWKTVPDGETVTIGANQQMIVVDGITIDGDLILEGDLALI